MFPSQRDYFPNCDVISFGTCIRRPFYIHKSAIMLDLIRSRTYSRKPRRSENELLPILSFKRPKLKIYTRFITVRYSSKMRVERESPTSVHQTRKTNFFCTSSRVPGLYTIGRSPKKRRGRFFNCTSCA